MKKATLVLTIVVLIALLCPTLALADSSQQASQQTGTVKTSAAFIWIRSGPGTTYKTLGKLNNGASVTILESVQGQAVYKGKPTWYRIGDGRYVYGALVSVSSQPSTPPSTPPQPPQSPQANAGKWIEVILSERKLIAWEDNTAVLTTIVAIGKPSTPTIKGTFYIYSKYLKVGMSGPGYYQPNVPHAMFFRGGYSIHGAYWHNKFGQAISHGCVNVNLTDAKTLYNWAPLGTKVVVHN